MPRVQTGVPGPPNEPFVVSFGVVGRHGTDGPDLREATGQLRIRVEGLKAQHRSEGWLGWDVCSLLRVTPDGRQLSWDYRDGVVDETRWSEAVEGVPERYDTVLLSSGPWGQIQLAAPSHVYHRSPIRALTAWVEVPTAGVTDAASTLLDQLAASARIPGVLTGFVHVDSIPDPYTAVVTADSRLSRDSFDAEVHGYYWALLLTDQHLERLGGWGRVRRTSPCESTELLEVADRRPVLCRLTESPREIDAERMRAWREFLLPVLRTGYPTGWEEVGQRATPLRRPLWLFEGAPAPRLIRSVLQHGRSDARALPVEWSAQLRDPECPACWLYPGARFDREPHRAAVNAVVNAWFTTGAEGCLFEVDGRLHRSSEATWDTDDNGVEALVWQVDTGTCDPKAALERLAAALSDLSHVLGGDVFDRLRVS